MHTIDNPQLWLPNGLDPADANKDGFPDYVTNYEWDGRIRIAFHPGGDPVRSHTPWPALTIGGVSNAEAAVFGDFDNDGNQDVVAAQGSEWDEHRKKLPSGLIFFWGPDSSQVTDSTAWVKSDLVPSSRERGHIHYTKGHDVNGDGLTDVVAGGRVHERNDKPAGLAWYEQPSAESDRRDVSEWDVHAIDPNLRSGHGFVFADFDDDGDQDIAVANADWDTPEDQEQVIVYENPGTEGAQKQQWPRHVLYEGSEFYAKPGVAVGDLNGDGRTDLLVPTEKSLHYFENTGEGVSSFEKITITKPERTQWLQRGIGIEDINGDGKQDILGMLIWKDLGEDQNELPTDKAAVYWMEYDGDSPGRDNWTTHTIKWGDGFVGKRWFGEKWDQGLFYDVDQDGDKDIVANVEEYHDQMKVYIAVVWFENPTID